MSDFVVLGITAGLSIMTWGLIELCERLRGGGR